jgi:uncharacterized protein
MTASRPRHVPLRRCVVCRRARPQAELLRFYRGADGRWRADETRRAGGRGAWLCADEPACQHVKALRRFFKNDATDVALALNAQSAAKGG